MIFYRSKAGQNRIGPSVGTVRILTALSLASYPAGALLLATGGDGSGGLHAFEVAGLALVLLAFVAAAPVLGSYFQKIVGEEARLLDEFELKVRQRAMSTGYGLFTGLTLLAIIYAAIAVEKRWWLPNSYETFNGLFWGAFLYASLLPTAALVWRRGAGDDLSEEEAS